MKPYLLGVDGGGSKTQARLADLEGNVLGRGRSDSSNYHTIGSTSAAKALRSAVQSAFIDAHIPEQPEIINIACFGMAGIGRLDDRAWLQNWIAETWPGLYVHLVSDAELVLAAGSESGFGVAVISGTGALAYGRDRSGQSARAGGWGYFLGDEGSGFAIGWAALRCVARAHDGRGPYTILSEAILSHWNIDSAEKLIRIIYQDKIPVAEIASLASLVETTGLAGDLTAQEILAQAGRDLAIAVSAVAHEVELDEPIPCALAGGVLTHSKLVASAFRSEAVNLGLFLEPVNVVDEPVLGAIQLARLAIQNY